MAVCMYVRMCVCTYVRMYVLNLVCMYAEGGGEITPPPATSLKELFLDLRGHDPTRVSRTDVRSERYVRRLHPSLRLHNYRTWSSSRMSFVLYATKAKQNYQAEPRGVRGSGGV